MESALAILEAVGLAAAQLNSASWPDRIRQVLAALGRATRVSRVYIFENRHDGERCTTSQTHEWTAAGVVPQADNPALTDFDYAANGFQRWVELLSEGRPVVGAVRALPVPERAVLEQQSIRSIAVVPIFAGSEWWGLIGFDDCVTEREWSAPELDALKAAANIFGAAVERGRMQVLEQRLAHLAAFDDLTGIPNRRALQEVLEREHARAARRREAYALVMLDLDRFKLVNDTYGHATGDQVLAAFARRAQGALRHGDWIGRWGGEEFLCVLPQTDPREARGVIDRLRRELEVDAFAAAGHRIEMRLSAGIAGFPEDGGTIHELIVAADAALYAAKRAGRNQVMLAGQCAAGSSSLAHRLHAALANGHLRAAYQPIVDLRSGELVAEETLARIVDSHGEVLPAQDFIEAASQLQVLHRVDYEMMRHTLTHCADGVLAGRALRHFVHLSTDLLQHRDLVDRLLGLTAAQCSRCDAQVGPQKPLVIEITERELRGDGGRTWEALAPFLELGLGLAIDGFGGAASFGYLARLPLRFIKVGRDLVRLARKDARVRVIVGGLGNIARDLGITTVAEHVEDRDAAQLMLDLGLDWGQGHYFGEPALG